MLQTSGLDSIVIYATGYSSAKVTQSSPPAGHETGLHPTRRPSASGGTLTANPVMGITDQYGNGTTNPYANFTVTASVSDSAAWTLGGSTVQQPFTAIAAFTDLSATVTGSTAVSGAAIQFTITGYTNSASRHDDQLLFIQFQHRRAAGSVHSGAIWRSFKLTRWRTIPPSA